MRHRPPVKTGVVGTDVVVLCGGKGTRLQHVVSDRPKPMAEIQGRPFLEILLDYVSGYGFERFILCAGYMSEYLKKHFSGEDSSGGIIISIENRPLGTAGALKNAEHLLLSNTFLVMNGDSFCPVNLAAFVDFHKQRQALVSVALVESDNKDDYGQVALDDSGRVIRFAEKNGSKEPLYINAGIYAFEKKALPLIPKGVNCSLEYDLFPQLAGKDFYGFPAKGELLDIGTPERYQRAKVFFGK